MRSIYLDILGFSLIYLNCMGNKKLVYKRGRAYDHKKQEAHLISGCLLYYRKIRGHGKSRTHLLHSLT